MASPELTQQLDRVREVAHAQLANFARLSSNACTESYLFKADHFCGIKIVLGYFHARWEVGQTAVTIKRGSNTLHTSSQNSTQRRAA